MHIDEQKKFDKRNVERSVKNGIISKKDYEIYLSKLPDVSDKIFNPEEFLNYSKEFGTRKDSQTRPKKKELRKKPKAKGKGKGK